MPLQATITPASPFAPAVGLWRRVTRSADSAVLTILVVAIAVAAAIVTVVFVTKGGGDGRVSGAAAGGPLAAEATSTDSASAGASVAAPTVESSQVEQVLGEYQRDYSSEDAAGLGALFAEDLERRDGSRAPEDRAASLATYEHQFSELEHPTYSLSGISVEPGPGDAGATARYSISSQNGTVTGSITYHLVEQGEKLLIDKLTIEPSQ
ncbi:MAG: hypothetical protein ACHQHO_08015 [Solirubrobacterales bacterium]